MLPGDGREYRAFDATTVREPGRTGSLWRIRHNLRLPSLACGFFEVTAAEGRGYLKAGGIRHVASLGGFATVRADTSSLPPRTLRGKPFGLLAKVSSIKRGHGAVLERAGARRGRGGGRACAVRKTGEAIALAHAKLRKASRGQFAVRPDTDRFAEHVIVFVTFPAAEFAAADVLDAYRVRWQVKLVSSASSRSPGGTSAEARRRQRQGVACTASSPATPRPFPWGCRLPA